MRNDSRIVYIWHWRSVLLLVAAFAGCGGSPGSPPPPNPVPSITSLSPSSVTNCGSGFTLTVAGMNFIASSTLQWNGSNRTTTYVSATSLTASVTASDVAVSATASITVVNPTPGGGTFCCGQFQHRMLDPDRHRSSGAAACHGEQRHLRSQPDEFDGLYNR